MTKQAANDNCRVQLFSRSSSRQNPGVSAWTCYGCNDKAEKITSGWIDHSTNIRSELEGLVSTLKTYPNGTCITYHSSSDHIVKGLNKHMHTWSKNGWITSRNNEVANVDLWRKLACEHKRLRIKTVWVHHKAIDKILPVLKEELSLTFQAANDTA
ncbi:RNase H family protein [Curvivirga sp.]|uniref:RNase H family protein n=1 Tax=Curvivirga sp. TaxID=2856848 RepID=UPI003B5B4475